MESLLNFLLFGCTHSVVTRPMNRRQICLNCCAYRYHDFSTIGEWRRTKLAVLQPKERV